MYPESVWLSIGGLAKELQCSHRSIYQLKADGSYRAPKQIADAMGHTLGTHLLSYSRFQTKDLASAFDETSLLVKARF